MKYLFTVFSIISLFNLYMFAEDGSSRETVKIYIIGDSTASYYDSSKYPRMGWGQVLQNFFDKTKIEVINQAISGRSSRSFYEEDAWTHVQKKLKKGDCVFIQFGHNDSKNDERYTEPNTTFKKFLKIYINESRKKGAIPVLLTPIHRNEWQNGKIRDTHGGYPSAMKELAAEMKVPLIDMHEKSGIFFESLGKAGMNEIFLILEPEKFKNYPKGIKDNTHFQENGAKEIAKLICSGIKEIIPDLAQFIL